ncbi:MAG: hypothetical protein IPO83_08565 [Chitinophagaceae bacterium]|nr:hypothetical protein [Chitinophagaceae bacterium]
MALLTLITTAGQAQFLNYYANFGNANSKMNFTCIVPKNFGTGAGNVYAIGTVDSTVLSKTKYIYVAEIDPNGSIVMARSTSIEVTAADINDYSTAALLPWKTYDGYWLCR